MILYGLLIFVVAAIIGCVVTMLVQRATGRSRAKTIIEEANREAEVIRQKELLKGREESIKIKDDAERQANQRMSKVQSAESKMKQREMQLNQQQSENQRQRNELDAVRQRLSAEESVLETRKEELDKLKRVAQDTLEHISGLSSDEAKEKLIESLKDEAKTAAAQYINEIMDEAKMTANKEAKRIVIQSIQRVATEAAIENSVTVFHIDSDEIKGATSVPSRPQRGLKSSLMTPPRQSCSLASTPCAAKLPVWLCISSLPTAAFTPRASRRL